MIGAAEAHEVRFANRPPSASSATPPACPSSTKAPTRTSPHHIGGIAASEHKRLKALSNTEPAGLLQVSADVDPDYTEGSELTYLHGVAVGEGGDAGLEGLDVIEVPAGAWAVFRTEGEHPAALQRAWAATATEWFPSNPCPRRIACSRRTTAVRSGPSGRRGRGIRARGRPAGHRSGRRRSRAPRSAGGDRRRG